MLIIKYGDSVSAIVDALQYQHDSMVFVNTATIETTRGSDGSLTVFNDTTWKDTGTEKYHPLYDAKMVIPSGTVFFTKACYPAFKYLIDDTGNDIIRCDTKIKCGVKVHLSSKDTGEFLIYWLNPANNRQIYAEHFGNKVADCGLSSQQIIEQIVRYNYLYEYKYK